MNLRRVIKRVNNRSIWSLKSGAQHYVSLLTNLCQQNKKVAQHCTVFRYILTTTDDHFISVWMQNAKTYTRCGIFLCKHFFFHMINILETFNNAGVAITIKFLKLSRPYSPCNDSNAWTTIDMKAGLWRAIADRDPRAAIRFTLRGKKTVFNHALGHKLYVEDCKELYAPLILIRTTKSPVKYNLPNYNIRINILCLCYF